MKNQGGNFTTLEDMLNFQNEGPQLLLSTEGKWNTSTNTATRVSFVQTIDLPKRTKANEIPHKIDYITEQTTHSLTIDDRISISEGTEILGTNQPYNLTDEIDKGDAFYIEIWENYTDSRFKSEQKRLDVKKRPDIAILEKEQDNDSITYKIESSQQLVGFKSPNVSSYSKEIRIQDRYHGGLHRYG